MSHGTTNYGLGLYQTCNCFYRTLFSVFFSTMHSSYHKNKNTILIISNINGNPKYRLLMYETIIDDKKPFTVYLIVLTEHFTNTSFFADSHISYNPRNISKKKSHFQTKLKGFHPRNGLGSKSNCFSIGGRG